MKVALFALVAITLASLGYAVSVQRGRTTPDRLGATSESMDPAAVDREGFPTAAELAELRVRVAALKAEMAELRGQVKSKPETVAPLPQPALPARAVPSRDPGAIAEQEAARHAAMVEVEAAFQRQAPDPGWAGAATASVRQALAADEVLRGVGGKVECRAQTCRVELLEETPGKVSDRLRPLLSGLGETLPRSTVDYEDEGGGRTRIVVYLDKNADPPSTGGRP